MVKAKKTKKLKATIPLKVQAYIQNKYYNENKEKPVIRLERPGKPVDTFKSVPIDAPMAKEASKVFDKVTYPIKVIIPKNKVKEYGASEIVFSKHKEGKNAVRYYTKKPLNDEQCAILFAHKDIRETHGFFINDVPGHGGTENLVRYIEWETKEIKRLLEQKIKDKAEEAIKEAKDDESKRAMQDLAKFSLTLQKQKEQFTKPLKKLAEPLEAMRSALNPFGFGNVPKIQEGGLLGKTILGGTIARPSIPKVKPDGVKRIPITGTGLTSYMNYHKLKNPVEISKKFLTKEGKVFKDADGKERKYVAKGFDHLRLICEQMNVNVEEAFLYICEGMNDSKSRWRTHRIDKEFWRGSQSVVNLVKYYNEQVEISKKDKNKINYTVKAFHRSPYCTQFFIDYGVHKPDYTKFSSWFKKMKHHVEVLKLDKK